MCGQVSGGVSRPASRACQRRAPSHHEVGVQTIRSTAGGVQTGQISQLLTFSAKGNRGMRTTGGPGMGRERKKGTAQAAHWVSLGTAEALPYCLEGPCLQARTMVELRGHLLTLTPKAPSPDSQVPQALTGATSPGRGPAVYLAADPPGVWLDRSHHQSGHALGAKGGSESPACSGPDSHYIFHP